LFLVKYIHVDVANIFVIIDYDYDDDFVLYLIFILMILNHFDLLYP